MRNARHPIRVGRNPRVFSLGKASPSCFCILVLLSILQLPQSVVGFGVTSVGSSRTFSQRVRTQLCAADCDSIANGPESPLRLISFDLDDTLFPTTEVVRAANKKMLDALKERGCGEVALPDYLATTKIIRRGLDSPSTYQGLRKMAIKQTFLNAGIDNDDKLDARVNECYQAWEDERHAAAQRFLYEDAINTLQTLQATYPDAAIVAITNGAGDPLQMKETLASYFDFTISGEMEAVFPHRKPHNFIYEYTLQQYQEKIDTAEDSALTSGGWVHVGDCLANDVGASTRCGAQAIWFCHLEEYEMGGTGDEVQMAASRLIQSKDTAQTPEWSTATPEEVAARKKQIEDGKQYVAATIHSLSELPDAVQSVLATKPPALQEN